MTTAKDSTKVGDAELRCGAAPSGRGFEVRAYREGETSPPLAKSKTLEGARRKMEAMAEDLRARLARAAKEPAAPRGAGSPEDLTPIATYEGGRFQARAYYIPWDDEYLARLYENGRLVMHSDYYGGDRREVIARAKAMAQQGRGGGSVLRAVRGNPARGGERDLYVPRAGSKVTYRELADDMVARHVHFTDGDGMVRQLVRQYYAKLERPKLLAHIERAAARIQKDRESMSAPGAREKAKGTARVVRSELARLDRAK